MADEIGTYGSATRQVIKDPNTPKQTQAATVPLSGAVMRPIPSSFSGVSSAWDSISKGLGQAAELVQKYAGTVADEEKVNGAMAYAMGKKASEMAAEGTRYERQGYSTAEAEAEALKFKSVALQRIAEKDHALDPGAYVETLQAEFKDLSTTLNKADPGVRSKFMDHASKIFPELVSKQFEAYNKYNKDRAVSAVQDLTVTALSDPLLSDDEVKGKISSNAYGLNPKDLAHAQAQALKALAESGDDAAVLRYMNIHKLPMEATDDANSGALGLPNGMLEIVAKLETTTGLSVDSAGEPILGEVIKSTGERAKGRYQVKPSVAKQPGYGVQPAADDSVQEYDRVGAELISAYYKKYGSVPLAVMSHRIGEGTVREAIQTYGDPRKKEISYQEFAEKVSNSANDVSGYMKDFMASYNPENLQESKQSVSLMRALVESGHSLQDASTLVKLQSKVLADRQNKFTTDRALAERDLVEQVGTGGLGYEAGLQKIMELKDKFKLGDSWASSMNNKITHAEQEFRKNSDEVIQITSAIASGTVQDLSPKSQKTAIDIVTKQLTKQAQSELSDTELMDPQAQARWVKDRKIDFLVANGGIVDKTWSNALQSAVVLPTEGKDGSVNPEVLGMYQDYVALKKKGGGVFAAAMAGKSAEFFETAMSFDSGIGSQQALLAAKEVQRKKESDPLYKEPKVDIKKIQTEVSRVIEDMDVSWFHGGQYTGGLTRVDTENELLKKDPRFVNLVTRLAVANRVRNPMDDNAERQAAQAAASRVEFALGNVLVGSPDSTILQDMGIQTSKAGAAEMALSLAIAKRGPEVYGDKWNTMDFASPLDSLVSKIRGVPPGHIDYQPSSKTALYYPKIRSTFGPDTYGSIPVVIPAEYAGALLQQYEVE